MKKDEHQRRVDQELRIKKYREEMSFMVKRIGFRGSACTKQYVFIRNLMTSIYTLEWHNFNTKRTSNQEKGDRENYLDFVLKPLEFNVLLLLL